MKFLGQHSFRDRRPRIAEELSRGQASHQRSPKRPRFEESDVGTAYGNSAVDYSVDDDGSVFPIDLDANELSRRLQEYMAPDFEEESRLEPSFGELQDLQQLAGYQNLGSQAAEVIEPTIEFDVDDDDASDISLPTPSFLPTMVSPSRGSSTSTIISDTSEPVLHQRSIHSRSKFVMTLGLWAEEAGLSRSRYTALLEILRMLKSTDEMSQPPEFAGTLKT